MPYRYINEAVITFTLDEITWCNQQAADLLGYSSPNHLTGIEPFLIVSDEHYFDLLMGAKAVMTTGKEDILMASLIHLDETPIPCVLHYSFNQEEGCFIAIIKPIMSEEAEENLVRFMELVRDDIKTPESVAQCNAELIKRMKINEDALAQNLDEVKYILEELRKVSNDLVDSAPRFEEVTTN